VFQRRKNSERIKKDVYFFMVTYYSKEAFCVKSWLDIKSIQTHGVLLIKLIAGPKMF